TTFLKTAGDAAEGAYCTFGGVAVSSYEGSAKEFAEKYKAAYHADPEAYAIYGYEAAKVALAAIAAAGVKDRTKIRDAVFATKDFKGIRQHRRTSCRWHALLGEGGDPHRRLIRSSRHPFWMVTLS
ncbi:MAG: hypothetical protein EBT47_04840, partial [Chloroflexi bacterium]|nr:hypothetical protein [Chloroflexota bacterium]